jgi:hypothetical protein
MRPLSSFLAAPRPLLCLDLDNKNEIKNGRTQERRTISDMLLALAVTGSHQELVKLVLEIKADPNTSSWS